MHALNQNDMPMREFLSDEEFFNDSIAKHHEMFMEQKLSIQSLSTLSPTDLVVLGVPLGDGITIIAAAKEVRNLWCMRANIISC